MSGLALGDEPGRALGVRLALVAYPVVSIRKVRRMKESAFLSIGFQSINTHALTPPPLFPLIFCSHFSTTRARG